MGEGAVLVLRTLVALACVVGIIWYGARRLGAVRDRAQAGEAPVRLVGRHALGRHAGVAVLAVGERRLLLGYGEQQVTLLTELDPVAAAAPEADAPAAHAVGHVPASVPASVPPPRALPSRAPRALVPATADGVPQRTPVLGPPLGPPAPAALTPAPRDFAEVITQQLSVVEAHAAHAARAPRARHGARPAPDAGRPGPVGTAVAGSVLDPHTWRQVGRALGRARR
jgi:flagellar protein FliO/FliZ